MDRETFVERVHFAGMLAIAAVGFFVSLYLM